MPDRAHPAEMATTIAFAVPQLVPTHATAHTIRLHGQAIMTAVTCQWLDGPPSPCMLCRGRPCTLVGRACTRFIPGVVAEADAFRVMDDGTIWDGPTTTTPARSRPGAGACRPAAAPSA